MTCAESLLIRRGPCSGELAAFHDQVFRPDRRAREEGLQDFAGTCGVARLRGQRRPGHVGVIALFGMVRHGWSAGGGCGNHTSPA